VGPRGRGGGGVGDEGNIATSTEASAKLEALGGKKSKSGTSSKHDVEGEGKVARKAIKLSWDGESRVSKRTLFAPLGLHLHSLWRKRSSEGWEKEEG